MTEPFTPNLNPEQPTSGAALLDELHDWLRGYVSFGSRAASIAVTLWAAHTHLVAEFDSTPRLALLSPEKQCGKSRVLELLELVCAGAETLSDASAPYLYRRIGAGPVTILIDEADAIWTRKGDENAEAQRSIVNAGHRKSARVGRVEMNGKTAELRRFSVYAPAALAGVGDCLPDTIMDRAVIVRMRRRAPDETIWSYRERVVRPEGEALAARLAEWATSVADKVGNPWPDMPAGVADRPADVWEPLLSVAELAGGDWPTLAAGACTEFVNGARDDTDSLGTRLLADLRRIFGDAQAVSTDTILNELHKIDEAPWADWYGRKFGARDLSKMLKPYGARPKVVRRGEDTHRGYRAADLHDAWSRYLPGGSVTGVTSVTPLASTVTDVTDVTDTPPTRAEATQSGEDLDAVTGVTTTDTEVTDITRRNGVSDGTTCRDCGRAYPDGIPTYRNGRCVNCDQKARTTP